MKMRNGFVSNSSSSSFVVVVTNVTTKCPWCGHMPESIIDLLDTQDGRCYGDKSGVESPDEYMDDLECERDSAITHITELERRNPNELTYPNYPARTLVKQSLEYAREELRKIEDRIAKFKKYEEEGKKVYRLCIEYHDHLAQRIFDENVERGLIEVIEGDN